MTYYEFLWRCMWNYDHYSFICVAPFILNDCTGCPFSRDGCIYPRDVTFTSFNQLVKFAQGLRKAGLLK